jgi:hypothetical protein
LQIILGAYENDNNIQAMKFVSATRQFLRFVKTLSLQRLLRSIRCEVFSFAPFQSRAEHKALCKKGKEIKTK